MGRRASRLVRAASAFGVCVLAVACNAISGAGDLQSGEEAVEGGTSTAPPGVLDGGGTADVVTRELPPAVDAEPPGACPSEGRRCIPEPPPGWDGPFFVYDGAPAEAPACPPSMSFVRIDAHRGAPTATHSCSPCSCGPAQGISCAATLVQYDYSDCSSGVLTQGPIGTSCVAAQELVDSVDVKLTSSGGSCAATGGVVSKSAITWPSALRACGAPVLLRDGCSAGEICAPDPIAPFKATHCISHAGEVACPAGWDEALVAHTGEADTRGCAPCSCGKPTNVKCTATLLHYSATSRCQGTPTRVSAPVTCYDGEDGSSYRLEAPPVGTGTCPVTPGGGARIGDVQPTDPVTICCRPS